MLSPAKSQVRPDPSRVVTKAVVRAAASLDLPNKLLARVLGLSEASVSRMTHGTYLLQEGQKPFELALLFLRLYRSLDAIAGGDERTARGWLRHENKRLGAPPLNLIQEVSGLTHVIAYLDARRAIV